MQLWEQRVVDLDAPGPLGMESTDLVLSGRVRPRLATGYALGSGGLKTVTHRPIVPARGGSVYCGAQGTSSPP
jgi:hypothetical protein